MSPGMKKRIRRGEYDFPNPEWSSVSQQGNSCSMSTTSDVNLGVDVEVKGVAYGSNVFIYHMYIL